MFQPTAPRGTSWLPLLLGAGVLLLLFGVVMADTHVPVPIAPDLQPTGGAQLATFALG